MKPRTVPTIPASRMLGSLAFVLAKAEERLSRGEDRFDAITRALDDHSVPESLNSTCREVWSAVTGEAIRETLARQDHLSQVLTHIRTTYELDHIHAMEKALG